MIFADRITTIPWEEFFKVQTDSMVSWQIVPDRTARNWNTNDLARALYEIFTPPLQRIKITREGIRYRPQEYFCFDITMTDSEVNFWLTIPERWNKYARKKIETIWPKATVKPAEIPKIRPGAKCAELRLKNHDLFSLSVARNDNRPLNSLLEVSKDLVGDDLARIQVLGIPADRQKWQFDAQRAYFEFRKGKPIRRSDLTIGTLATRFLEFADAFMNDLTKALLEFIQEGGPDGLMGKGKIQSLQQLEREREKRDPFASLLRSQQGLNEATIKKISEPPFSTMIRIAVNSEDPQKAELIKRALATSYNDLDQDNELQCKDIHRKKYIERTIQEINTFKAPKIKINFSTLSASEMGKLIQLPGAELQNEFPRVSQVPLRETDLPNIITGKGIQIGTVTNKGITVPVHLPIKNHDELCLPHVVIGGMGTGKTRGFGSTLAIEAVKNGMAAIVIDPAKREISDEISLALPPEKIVRIDFGKDPISLDWREVVHGERSRNRLANELISFCEAASDAAGAQTIRFLRAAAKAVPTGRLSEILALLTNQEYRTQAMENMRAQERATWEQFDALTDARQSQIAQPVLNRLDVIEGDDYLAECMDAEKGIDFVELLKEPRAIVVNIPKSELGAEAVDILAALISTKIDLAMVLRETTFPTFIIQDEPHQYVRSAKTWRAAAVESRKWRFSYCWMFHAWEQIPRDVAAIIQAAGPHYHLYTSSKATYRALGEEIKPFDIEEAMATPRHFAINIIRAGGQTLTPFLAKMSPPPSMQ